MFLSSTPCPCPDYPAVKVPEVSTTKLTTQSFGKTIDPETSEEGEEVMQLTLTNEKGMKVEVITYGAAIKSIIVPDGYGGMEDVVLGYNNIEGYQTDSNPYMGATVGRVCNRIKSGRCRVAGSIVQLSQNRGSIHQHGGFIGFNKKVWTLERKVLNGFVLKYVSPDEEEGYPGELHAFVTYTLGKENVLDIKMDAVSSKQTVVNMTNHAYFNLAGHGAGKTGLYAQNFIIHSERITETDVTSIPTGEFLPVEKTAFDFRTETNLGQRLKRYPRQDGFDNNFCVLGLSNPNEHGRRRSNEEPVPPPPPTSTKRLSKKMQSAEAGKSNRASAPPVQQKKNDEKFQPPEGVHPVARVRHPLSGRWLEVASNQPGVQFYTANFFPDLKMGEEPLKGKAEYTKHAGFCLETQKYPDAPNQSNFPSILLKPGEQYSHHVRYTFGADKAMQLEDVPIGNHYSDVQVLVI